MPVTPIDAAPPPASALASTPALIPEVPSLAPAPGPGDERRMITFQLEPGLTCLRGLSPRRLRFEVEYGLERGSSANSFLIVAGNGSDGGPTPPVLVHPPGIAFAGLFLERLAPLVPCDQPLRVVAGVVNPNRVQFLRLLAQRWPALVLVASNAGAQVLRELWDQHRPALPGSGDGLGSPEEGKVPPLPPIDVIRGERALDLAGGLRLRLLPAPTPRWPGGLMAFEERSGLLMSSKFFSAHLCTESFAEASRAESDADRRWFHDCLMAPMAQPVGMVLDRLDSLPIRTIAPFHGPAVDQSWRSLLADYRRWGERQEGATRSVALLYASAYGNTAAIADALARGVTGTGVRVESLNCEFASTEELVAAIRRADALLLGSPTLGGHAPTPMVSALGTVLAEADRTRPVGVFGSFGWSGEAIDLLERKLGDGGFRFAFAPIRVKFSPDPATLRHIEAQGAALGRRLREEMGRSRRAPSGGGMKESRHRPAIRALGRLVGSLCVLTVRQQEDGSSDETSTAKALLVRSVSQASFTPPSISMAIPMEKLGELGLKAGDPFALNVLAAGREKELLRRLQKSPAAGVDPLEGMPLESSPGDQPLLRDALAWLEGRVSQWVECGDHCLMLADVFHGGVFDPSGSTAVKQRRSGAEA